NQRASENKEAIAWRRFDLLCSVSHAIPFRSRGSNQQGLCKSPNFQEAVFFTRGRNIKNSVSGAVEIVNGLFSLLGADLLPPVMELDKQLIHRNPAGKQILDDRILGPLNIHLQ